MIPEKQDIWLHINTHHVQLEVPGEQEEVYRKAAKYLNETYKEYLTKTKGRLTAERVWVYVALHAAVELFSDIRDKDIEPILTKIDELNKQIELQTSVTDETKDNNE